MNPKDKTQNRKKQDATKKKVTSKQVVAIGGIILLVLMYLGTLIVAIVDSSASMALFQACLVATFAIPFLIWIYIWMYGKLTRRHTIADFDIGGVPEHKAGGRNKDNVSDTPDTKNLH